LGIHYNYKAKRGERAMQKEQKRKDRLANKKSKRAPLISETISTTPTPKVREMHDINKVVTLDDLTNPEN
jgi:hypothetical protein